MINQGILPSGTTYQLEAPLTIQDESPVTGEWVRKTYPVGTEVRILKHKKRSEGAYRYVDYDVELPDGMKTVQSAKKVHQILGIPAPSLPKKK